MAADTRSADSPFAQDRDRFKEQVRQEWTDAEIVGGWRRWHSKHSYYSRPLTDAIVEAAHIAAGMEVLDLASGTGDPALTLAERIGPEGHVTATDLSAGMLDGLAENAREQRIVNLTAQVADAEALPFADESYDAVTCRLGIMYCPDTERALREIRRVLRPGGRAAFVVWDAPSEQSYFTAVAVTLMHYAELPSCEVGAPNPFRFAPAGSLTAALKQAGFQQVIEERRQVMLTWPGPPTEYWEHIQDSVPFLRPMLAELPKERRDEAVDDVLAALGQHYDGELLQFPASIVVGSGGR